MQIPLKWLAEKNPHVLFLVAGDPRQRRTR